MNSQVFNNVGFFQAVFALLCVILIYKGLRRMFSSEKSALKSTTRRRLGRTEAILNLLSEERQGTTDICLILTLRSDTELKKDYVRQALVLLAKRQPLLRAIITTPPNSDESATTADDKYFEIMNGDEINDMIDFTSSEVKACQWQDVWQEVAFKGRGTRLLWKLVMLQEEFLPEAQCYSNTLIFNFSHCCIDGVSSMKFLQQFLHYLNGLADGSFTSDEDISSLILLPSFLDLLTGEGSWSLWQFLASCSLTKLILRKVVRWKLSRKQCNPFLSSFPPNSKQLSTPRNNKMSFKTFNENETSKIIKACRLNGCTVTGALIAASHLAFCNLLRDDAGYICSNVQLEYGFAINSQRACQTKPPKEYLGVFICGPILSFSYTDHDESCFWKLANEARKRIKNEVKGDKYARETVGLFNCFSSEEIVNELLSPLNRQTFIRLATCAGMSSIGSFDFRDEQKHHRYKLHECIFNSLVHNYACLFANFNTTVNGKMSWVILYDPSKFVNGSHAERFANLSFGYLIKICQ